MILLLDDAPGHPSILDSFQTCVPNDEIVFISPNTSLQLQPMDQGQVIFVCKACYHHEVLFSQAIILTDNKYQSVTKCRINRIAQARIKYLKCLGRS